MFAWKILLPFEFLSFLLLQFKTDIIHCEIIQKNVDFFVG